jgi:hypothetical protein
MGMYGVPGMITTIKRVLDNPQSNSITVDTSYTDDEELVGNIITATNTVLNNTDIYTRTAIIKGDGTIDSAAISRTLENNNGNNISFVGVNGSTLLDSKGLLVSSPGDPTRKMKYSGLGVFGTINDGITYEPLLTPEGINANYISSGSIDTHKIQIMSGLHSKVVLDSQGLSIKDDHAKPYILPGKEDVQTIDGTDFPDWSQSNLRAFLGVGYDNSARLYLKGQMQIEGGSSIAGWRVTTDRLSSGSGSNYVGLSSAGDYAFWAGGETPQKASVVIKSDGTGIFKGELHASALYLDPGVTIDYNNNITNTPNINKAIDDAVEYCVFQDGTIGKLSSDVNTSETIGGFKVSKQGLLQASNAVIQGTIYAKDGKFTGDIVANSLTLGDGVFIDYNQLTNVPDIPDAPDLTYYIRQDGTVSGTQDGKSRSFTVSKQGLLTATNAIITGKVTASEGTIGGWNLNGSYFGYHSETNNSSGASSNYFLSAGGKYSYCTMNGSNTDNFHIFMRDKFAVTTAGKLYTRDAVLTGGTISINGITMKTGSITIQGVEGTTVSGSGIFIGAVFISDNVSGQMGYYNNVARFYPFTGSKDVWRITACSDWGMIPTPQTPPIQYA